MILRKIEGTRYSEILRAWEGETVAVLAGGPSFTQADAMDVFHAGLKCIAVNDSFLRAPWADVCYAADASFHQRATAGYPKLGFEAAEVAARWADFQGQKVSIQDQMDGGISPDVHIVRNADLPIHPGTVQYQRWQEMIAGRNSGHQAMNLAVKAGATRILMLGFDAKRSDDGKTHWHGGHGKPVSDEFFSHMRQAFSAAEKAYIAAGVEVINCCLDSTIDSFPKVALDEVLCAHT